MSISSSADARVMSVGSRRPARSAKIAPGSLTRMSATSGSSTSGCSGPRPHTAASTDATIAGVETRSSSGLQRMLADCCPEGCLALWCAVERVQDLRREAGNEPRADRAERLRADRRSATELGRQLAHRRSPARSSRRTPASRPRRRCSLDDGTPGNSDQTVVATGRRVSSISPSLTQAGTPRSPAASNASRSGTVATIGTCSPSASVGSEPSSVARLATSPSFRPRQGSGRRPGDPQDVGQRLDPGRHDAEHRRRLTDEVAVPLLERCDRGRRRRAGTPACSAASRIAAPRSAPNGRSGPRSLQLAAAGGQEADAEARLDGPLLVGERIRPVVAGRRASRLSRDRDPDGGRPSGSSVPRRGEARSAAEPRHRASGIARASR